MIWRAPASGGMFSQTSGRHLLFFRRWCWALSQRGTPLCRVRRERLSGPDLPHPAEEGDSSPPSPCLTPADGTGALFSYSQQISSAGTSEPARVNLGQSRFLDREFAAQTRREVSEAYRPVSGFSLPPSVVLELSSVLSVMDSRSISPSAMTYSPRVRVRNSQAS